MKRTSSKAILMTASLPLLVGPICATGQEGEEPETEEREAVMAFALAATPARSFLGVRVEDVGPEDVEELNLREERGARVVEVVDDSPAASAGLREDDLILSWNGEPVESVAELTRLVRETPPGRTARVGVVRRGATREVTVTLEERSGLAAGPGGAFHAPRAWMRRLNEGRLREIGERTEEALERARERLEDVEEMEIEIDAPDRVGFFVLGGRGRLGVRLQSLTEQLGDYFGVEESGALISGVRDDSPAEKAGLRAGDVIVGVAGRDVEGPADVARAVRGAEAGPVSVTVVRDGEERGFTVELPERERRSGAPGHEKTPTRGLGSSATMGLVPFLATGGCRTPA